MAFLFFPLSPFPFDACLREAPPSKVLVRRAGASAKVGERVGVRGVVEEMIHGSNLQWDSALR
jgi:hypothetical protein